MGTAGRRSHAGTAVGRGNLPRPEDFHVQIQKWAWSFVHFVRDGYGWNRRCLEEGT